MSVLDIGLCEHGNVYASINFLYHTCTCTSWAPVLDMNQFAPPVEPCDNVIVHTIIKPINLFNIKFIEIARILCGSTPIFLTQK